MKGMITMLEKCIENYKDEIIKHTQELIRIPSVHKESNDPSMPFGKEANNALEYMLNLGQELGFRTKNIDGYCGYIEFGEGSEMLGIIGHLDVVPEGENWTFPPFSGTICDGNIYGRGAIDDKGPVIASLYAMKAVMDNCQISKRVRLILGLNEERDWKCINYYKAHEELPTIGFSPDADFPCIYAEKAVLTCYLTMDYKKYELSPIKIIEIDTNKNPINVVPKQCSCILKVDNKSISMKDVINTLKNIINSNNFEIDIYKIDDENVKITSYGTQAHAAHPDLGINAISHLIIVLNSLFKAYKIEINILNFFSNYIGEDYYGEKLGINFKDESGMLTLNVGDFKLENNILKIGMNLRVPVNTPIVSVGNQFLKLTSPYIDIDFETKAYNPALFVPKDDKLVKTLCRNI